MDCLSPLNLNGFYANKKPWHPAPWFLTPSRVSEVNMLIQQFNARLNRPPTGAHHGLYMRFSSAYFWESMAHHPNVTEAQSIWENCHWLAYVENANLIWLIDYALPLLGEYANCAIKDCQRLEQHAQYPIRRVSPHDLPPFLEAIHQLNKQLTELLGSLSTLKKQWCFTVQLKVEKQNDLLKMIAKKIDVPCDFSDISNIDASTLIFLTQAHPNKNLILPFLKLDKNPPIISILEARSAFEQLSERLRELKRTYRLRAPQFTPFNPFWLELFNNKNLSYASQFRLKIAGELFNWGSVPLMIWLFLQGWISFTSMGMGAAIWLGFPLLTKLPAKIWHAQQQIVYFVKSYLDGMLPDFLVEQAEYIETIERSALWRKDRLSPGCHDLNTFEPDAIVSIYDGFQQSLTLQINDLQAMRPPLWHFWRHHTRHLIDALIHELTVERTALNNHMKLYGEDLASRANHYLLKSPAFLEKISPFILRFAPHTIDNLNAESKAIDFFLCCITCDATAGILIKRPLSIQKAFATHCSDNVAIQNLEELVTPFIKHPQKLQALVGLSKLLQQREIISPEQALNFVELLCSPSYSKKNIMTGIQTHLYSTFTGKQPAIQKYLTPKQNRALHTWLETQKEDLVHAYRMVNDFLALPSTQDWGKISQRTILLHLHYAERFINLIQLDGRQDLLQQLQEKILQLAPNYSGCPTVINNWIPILWQGKTPIALEERILHARLNWTLQETQAIKNDKIVQLLIEDASQTFARADNDHRLTRAFINEPCFYLPWNTHIQSTIEELEKAGLLLPQAKAAYSQKGLQQWLQNKP